MEKLEQVLEYWGRDSTVDETEPSREIIRIPLLHSKYLKIMSEHKLASKRAHFDYAKLRKTKWEYYTGKMSKEELQERGWEPFRYTLKSDVSTYIEADEDLVKLLLRKNYHDEVVDVCESILRELNNRTYQLREHMQHERFIMGGR